MTNADYTKIINQVMNHFQESPHASKITKSYILGQVSSLVKEDPKLYKDPEFVTNVLIGDITKQINQQERERAQVERNLKQSLRNDRSSADDLSDKMVNPSKVNLSSISNQPYLRQSMLELDKSTQRDILSRNEKDNALRKSHVQERAVKLTEIKQGRQKSIEKINYNSGERVPVPKVVQDDRSKKQMEKDRIARLIEARSTKGRPQTPQTPQTQR